MSAAVDLLTAEEELHWLALILVPGLGTRKAGQLVRQFGTPVAAFRASVSELEGAGLAGSVARSIASGCTFDDAISQQEKVRAAEAQVIPLTDPRYPAALREVFDPPVLLFARGRVELLQSILLGVVGTRRPTPYGVAAAERLSADLARAGLTIVSGMARGIDTTAHKSALAADGKTVAVFGCGVDNIYPAENRKLAAEIAEKGLLISEFPMGAPAYPQNFPVRNRIISGMSVGVLVVEGAQYSGSAITARMAAEQEREVFAVPGSIMSKMSWGPNLLIKEGAKLVQDWNDVVVELPAEVRRRLIAAGVQRLLPGEEEANDEDKAAKLELSKASRDVLQRLRADEAIHLDRIFELMEPCSSSEVIAALFELEMTGLARQLPGRNYVKVW
ncbi:MAG TPA: DNA-processing protein DprA [Bryobacteraceae bacterium]|nr:DNA-processing protein DprA [Bryobacteraceae bacterium]